MRKIFIFIILTSLNCGAQIISRTLPQEDNVYINVGDSVKVSFVLNNLDPNIVGKTIYLRGCKGDRTNCDTLYSVIVKQNMLTNGYSKVHVESSYKSAKVIKQTEANGSGYTLFYSTAFLINVIFNDAALGLECKPHFENMPNGRTFYSLNGMKINDPSNYEGVMIVQTDKGTFKQLRAR